MVHPGLDGLAQWNVLQLERLWPAGLFGCTSMGYQRVIVPVGKTIAAIFTPDHRAVTPDLVGNLGMTQAGMQTPVDLDTLLLN